MLKILLFSFLLVPTSSKDANSSLEKSLSAEQDSLIITLTFEVFDILDAAQTEAKRTKRESLFCLRGIKQDQRYFVHEAYKPPQTTFLGFKMYGPMVVYASTVKRLEECPADTVADLHTHPGISQEPWKPSRGDIKQWVEEDTPYNLHLISYTQRGKNKCSIYIEKGRDIYAVAPQKPFLLNRHKYRVMPMQEV
jgi:proteasome lid subunit RPN8/RPN11